MIIVNYSVTKNFLSSSPASLSLSLSLSLNIVYLIVKLGSIPYYYSNFENEEEEEEEEEASELASGFKM